VNLPRTTGAVDAQTTLVPLSALLAAAADAVAAVRAGRSLNDALAACPATLRPGAQAIAFHAMRWLGAAQTVRIMLAPRSPPPPVDALLLAALALLWPGSGEPYATHTVVDQAVSAARQMAPRAASFINAVLRRFVRDRDALVTAARRDPLAAYNHPVWWVDRVRVDWPDVWQALLEVDQQHPPMTLRVNARHGSAETYLRELAQHGLAAAAIGPHAVVLEAPRPVQQLPGFDEGRVSVQDAAAQRAAPLLIGGGSGTPQTRPGALRAGARVLDACAAPGGKTAHLLELADLDLLALDVDAGRLARVKGTLERLHLAATLRVGDASDPGSWWDGRPFDAILLDAPCTGSGIVRRHPDVRWLRRAGDVGALARTQARMLDALWPLLRPGGRLLYGTCSIFRAEGQDQIDAFLQRVAGPEPRVDPESPGHLLPLPDNETEGPVPSPADGFFYALLHKP
jgi:16S rRNA (cytosine967-C5)-methyltransferase